MKKLLGEANSLAKEAEEISANLRAYDPDTRSLCKKVALPFLAADAGTLAYRYANLRVEINRRHEKEQRDEIL